MIGLRTPASPAAEGVEQATEPARRSLRTTLAVAGIVAVAAFVRWLPAAAGDFPVNDGGLFMVMAEEIRAAGYRLPEVTSYNGADIPFAYPPLGLYLAALVSELPGVDVLDALRVVPVAASVLAVVVMIPLATRVLGSRQHALLAAAVFALLPQAYRWHIMGGGITRSVGFLLALLALTFAWDAYERGHRGRAALAAVLVAGAYLAHLEGGMFATYGAAIMLLAHRARLRENLVLSLAGGVVVVLVTAPWWATVVARHGLEPFLAASGTSGWALSPVVLVRILDVTDTPLTHGLVLAAVVGVLWSLRTRTFLVPAWYLLVVLLTPRQAMAFSGVPLGMLAARGLLDVLVPALGRPISGVSSTWPARLRWRSAGGALVAYTLGMGVLAAFVANYFTFTVDHSLTAPLAPEDRAAMTWVAAETPDDSTFLIIDDSGTWDGARPAEWFPALTERQSVATAQGTEWLPGEAFMHATDDYESLQECRHADADCLLVWTEATGRTFTHVYLATAFRDRELYGAGCCPALAQSLEAHPAFREVYNAGGVLIYERVPATLGGNQTGPTNTSR